MAEQIRVMIVDDEAMVRAGVRAILAAAPDLAVVAEAGDGRAALELARAHRPDVVLLDIRMPVLDGLDAAAELRRALPGTAVVMLTTFSEEEYIVRALESGVAGFLLKSGDLYELMAAIHAAHGGAAYLSPEVAHRVIRQVTGGSASRRAPRSSGSRRSARGSGRFSPWSAPVFPMRRSRGASSWWRVRSKRTSAPC